MAKPAGQLIYREVQYFAPWVYALSAIVLAVGSVALLLEPPPTVQERWAVGAIIFLLACILLPLRLEIEVRTAGLFARLRPLWWMRISLERYKNHQPVTYRPIMDYGGWGIRWGRGGRAYTARGCTGVRLDYTDGRHVLLGSQAPQRLNEAIAQLLASNP